MHWQAAFEELGSKGTAQVINTGPSNRDVVAGHRGNFGLVAIQFLSFASALREQLCTCGRYGVWGVIYSTMLGRVVKKERYEGSRCLGSTSYRHDTRTVAYEPPRPGDCRLESLFPPGLHRRSASRSFVIG